MQTNRLEKKILSMFKVITMFWSSILKSIGDDVYLLKSNLQLFLHFCEIIEEALSRFYIIGSSKLSSFPFRPFLCTVFS